MNKHETAIIHHRPAYLGLSSISTYFLDINFYKELHLRTSIRHLTEMEKLTFTDDEVVEKIKGFFGEDVLSQK